MGTIRKATSIAASQQVASGRHSTIVTNDWFDFLSALLAARVRFLVVGAHALAAHGVPRATQDLDVWIEPTVENAQRVWSALGHFGAPADALGITESDLITPDTVVQFGVPPNRIDILTAISGVPLFSRAWDARIEHIIRGQTIPFLGKSDFVMNKRASGRHKDLGDIEALGEQV